MIKKEVYKNEEGVVIYRTFSDTDHKIRNKKTGVVYSDATDIYEDEEYEEVEDYIELEGPDTYDEVLKKSKDAEEIARKINLIGLSDNEALSVKEMYPRWESKIGFTIEVGYVTMYNSALWKARQTHTALEVYPPSVATASLYEVVVYHHEGTESDPIPYTPPMEIFEGKYYVQDGVKYLCTRNSGTALSHNLSDLVGIYVELIDK
jgi:hypothetical protein